MSVIDCPDCGKTVSTSAVACPHCGRPNAIRSLRPEVPTGGMGLAPRPNVQIASVLGCPYCGSPATSKFRGLYIVGAILLFPIGLLLLLLPRRGSCLNPACGKKFDAPTVFR